MRRRKTRRRNHTGWLAWWRRRRRPVGVRRSRRQSAMTVSVIAWTAVGVTVTLVGWGLGRSVSVWRAPAPPAATRAPQASAPSGHSAASWLPAVPAIRTIDIRGVRELRVEQVRQLLGFDVGDGLFAVSFGQAIARLESHPWVAAATLSRVLPDRVVVQIVEREPVALIREGATQWYVDAEGVLLGAPGGDVTGAEGFTMTGLSLHELRADEPQARRRLHQALSLLTLLRRQGVETLAMAVQEDESLLVSMGHYRLIFGPTQHAEQWRRYRQVASRIPPDDGRREIDLRFTNSVVVRL